MAGDWIKVEHALPTKTEVSRIADIVGSSENEVVGALIRLWIWADENTADGHALSVTETTLDRRADCKGLADAMRKVGWLGGRDAALSFPNFTRHNGQSSKARALATERKNKQRHGVSVTETGPEKRREELREREESAAAKFPSEADVIAHAASLHPPANELLAKAWWNEMDGAGWFDRQKRPVHPAHWKSSFNSAHYGDRRFSGERAARKSEPPPKKKGPNI